MPVDKYSGFDPSLALLLYLKNSWSLIGLASGSNISFNTGWYNSEITQPIQVTIIPTRSSWTPINLNNFRYMLHDTYQIDLWVRPDPGSSNRALGEAKDALWKMRDEVSRLLHTGSKGLRDIHYISIIGWTRNDDITQRPVIMRYTGLVDVLHYRTGSA